MSKETFADAFVPAEVAYCNIIMQNTYGHLAPQKNRTYKGRIVWAVGCFAEDSLNPTPIFCEFKGLNSSPWFYRFLNDFLQLQEWKEGCIYEFRGIFKNYEFKGQIKVLLDTNEED